MKKFSILLALSFCAAGAYSQSKMACCAKSATQEFAMLASSKKFVMSHKVPKPLHFQSSIGKPVTYKTPDGKESTGYELKAKTPTENYILVIHEYWGLNDYIKRECELLYNDLGNVNVIALDLYDGKVATTREDAGKFMQGVKDDRAQAIIKGALAYVGPKAHIATIGWCFGGGWSLQASLLAGKQDVACVMYYGMPEKSIDRLKMLHADVLGNFASKDQWINTKVVEQFEADMKAAGKKLYVHEFDADHAFANPSSPSSNTAAARQDYTYNLAFLKPLLK
jgi:carboxymethylenebutenolidase